MPRPVSVLGGAPETRQNAIARGQRASDEERNRAEEGIFSVRRAELARTRRTSVRNHVRLFNTRLRDGESMRVYPLSNRTEHDVWEYLAAEEIDVVLLYFAAVRPVVRRGGFWIAVDDERLPLKHGERPECDE